LDRARDLFQQAVDIDEHHAACWQASILPYTSYWSHVRNILSERLSIGPDKGPVSAGGGQLRAQRGVLAGKHSDRYLF
jgi:hypothetical protein